MAALAEAGGRPVAARYRVDGRVLFRVDMPTPGLCVVARRWVTAAGFVPGGNDTPWECQVVFTVPVGVVEAAGRAGLPPTPRSLGE